MMDGVSMPRVIRLEQNWQQSGWRRILAELIGMQSYQQRGEGMILFIGFIAFVAIISVMLLDEQKGGKK